MDKKQCSSNTNMVFIGFFADWCGHCVKFKPEWEATRNASPKNVGWVDDYMHGTLRATSAMKLYKVTGFPTVLVYLCREDNVIQYEGTRTKKALLAFIKSYQENIL